MPDSKYSTCQILINASAGLLPARTYYTCNLQGRYEAKLIGVTFADNVADNRIITLQSDSFRLIYGNTQQSFAFCNRTDHTHGNPQGEFPFVLEASSSIDLTLTSSAPYDNGENNAFQFCILTFAVRKID
jgi:hypothetical protein